MNDSNNNIFVGWQNGFEKTKILQGDCLQHMEQMDKGVIKLIITSPPYYNAREYIQWKTNPNTERIYLYQKPTKHLNDKIISRYQNEDVCLNIENGEIWYINPKKSKKHTAPFPNEIPNRLIQLYSWKGDIVYDPFGGEGTTADECEKLGRNCVISELNTNYCEVIKEGRKKNIIVDK